MGTITTRKRKSGTRYTAQIRIMRGGSTVHTESQTFDRKQAAQAWMKRRETELSEPGALEATQANDPPLGDVIDQYVNESEKAIGRTKAQVLRAIKRRPIAAMPCSTVRSADIIAFAQSLDVTPQTRMNYLSHLSAIFAIARPAWGHPLDQREIQYAMAVAKRLGVTSKSRQRDRRPTIEELDRLMAHFGKSQARRIDAVPMQTLVAFAIFSTRRQDEILRIRWEDWDGDRVMVRDMKSPGEKIGNDQWCDLPPEAQAIIKAQPRRGDRIFPFSTDAVSANFTRACKFLGIEDLHFHDLRHHGISRLFEMGWNIPHVASVSGHRSWQSLKRYTHLRQKGDGMAGWKWLPVVAAA